MLASKKTSQHAPDSPGKSKMEGAWGKGGSPSGAAALGGAMAADPMKTSQHSRLLFAMLNLVGMDVTVHVKNGAVYEGIFHTCRPENAFGVVLRHVTQVKPPTGESHKDGAAPKYDVLAVYHEDFTMMTAKHADLGFAEAATDSFQTDAEISAAEFRERELQRWEPSDGVALGGLEDDSTLMHNEPFDQFAGKASTFDEALYTTELDKSEFDRAAHERAARIADQIMKGTSANVHVAEERGQVTEKDYDEEDRYGAVIRNGGDQAARPDNPNRYIPPSQRNATQQQAHMAAKARSGSPATAPVGDDAQPTATAPPAKMSFAQMMKSGPKPAEGAKMPSPAPPASRTPDEKPASPAPQKAVAPASSDAEAEKVVEKLAAVSVAEKAEDGAAKPDEPKAADNADKGAKEKGSDAAAEEKPKSKLNPNAKAFTMNVNAKPFVPSFAPKPAQENAPAEGPGRGAKDQDFGPQGRGPKGGMVDPDMQASPTFGGPAYPPMMPGQPMVFPSGMMMPPGQFPPGPMYMPQQKMGPFPVYVPAAANRVFAPMPGMPFDGAAMPMMGMPPGAMFPGPGVPAGFAAGPYMMPEMEGEMMPPPGPPMGRRGAPGDMLPRGPKGQYGPQHGPGGPRGGAGFPSQSPKASQQQRGQKHSSSPHPPANPSPQPQQQSQQQQEQ